MNEHKPISLAYQVFEKIETDILSGAYPRGTVLTELSLSAELGVSRTPIREALGMLKNEDLIEETSKGAVVIGVSPEDIDDIFNIRLKIEGDAVALACDKITEKELSQLQERLELHEFYSEKGDADRMKEVDSQFHDILYRATGSRTYYNNLRLLHKKAQRYRKLSVTSSDRAKASAKEHRAIYEALKQKNKALAKKVAEEHVRNAAYQIHKGEDR